MVHIEETAENEVIILLWFLSGHLTGFHVGHRALGYCAPEEGGASRGDDGRQLTSSRCHRNEGAEGPRMPLESTMRVRVQAQRAC